MATPIAQFSYDLPGSFIAQAPVEPRDHSRLMVLDRATGEAQDKHFFDLVDELVAGDVLVFNTSKVFKARLTDGGVELFILKIKDGAIEALIKPGRKFPVGSALTLFDRNFIVDEVSLQGICALKTNLSAMEMFAFCEEFGQVPTPPYVKADPTLDAKYQNVYAKQVGSVAAPTAGFHFTSELLEKIKAKGVQIEEVVLHVGIGTFRPVQVETLEEHVMHSEWVSLDESTAKRLRQAKSEGRRIIAVGTTTTRAIEGIANMLGALKAYEGEVNMFITPGYDFKIIDGLITNFHLPKSTLLVLVSAFAGRERILAAYELAKQLGYRFFSFGDAMFIR